MSRRFLMVLTLIGIILGGLACQSEPVTPIINLEETGESFQQILTTSIERVNNCGAGGDTIYKSPSNMRWYQVKLLSGTLVVR